MCVFSLRTLLILHSTSMFLAKATTTEDGYTQIQIPASYWSPLNENFAMTKRDCAFECSHVGADCKAFTFENDQCQLANITVPQDSSNFVPSYVSDADAKKVLIKKKHVVLKAKEKVTHLGKLFFSYVAGAKYDLVMDDQDLMKVTITAQVAGPYFAVIPYRGGLIACGGNNDNVCRFWSFVRQRWTTMKGNPGGNHYNGAFCIFEDRLWLFGGRSQEDMSSAVHTKVDSYDLFHQQWRREAQELPSDLKGCFFPATVIPEKSQALLVGGRRQNGDSFNNMAYIFSFTDGSYSSVGSMASGTGRVACAFLPWSEGQKIVCAGGTGANGDPQDKSYIYDVETGSFNQSDIYKLPDGGQIGFVEFKDELYHYHLGDNDIMYRLVCTSLVDSDCDSASWEEVNNGGITGSPNGNFVFKIDYHEIKV